MRTKPLQFAFLVFASSCLACRLSAQAPAASPPDPQAIVKNILAQIDPQRIKADIETLQSFGTRHTLSDTASDTHGIGAARRWIKSQFEHYAAESGRTGDQTLKVFFDSHTYGPDRRRVRREVDIVNVVAELSGSMPEARQRRYYVIAHYDSCCSNVLDAQSPAPGANDDGSGVALVMELARVCARHQFDATLVFMTTAGEEQGLLGAKLYAEEAGKAGLDIRGVLNNDIVGDPVGHDGVRRDQFIRVFSEALPQELSESQLARIRALGAENDSPSRELARYVFDTAQWLDLPVKPMLIFRHDRFLRGGDHFAFNDNGFPAVRFTTVSENYDHQHQDVRVENGTQYGDLPQFVDPHYLASVAEVNGAALICLAQAPSAPGHARIVTASLGYGATLRWEPSPEPDTAGYEIVYRLTTEPNWTHAVEVPGAASTEKSLDVSKDDYFFGIRALDQSGYRSPVTFCSASSK